MYPYFFNSRAFDAYAPRASGSGSLNLSETSPPQSFSEPITVAEAKSFLYLDAEDTSRDFEVACMISAAREQGEIFQGCDLVRKRWDLSFDYWPGHRIALRDPLASVDWIEYRESSGQSTRLVEDVDYLVDTAQHPGFVTPAFGKTWPSFTPWPSSAVTMRFLSGYAASSVFWSDAGMRVRQGMLLLISNWFENRLPTETSGAQPVELPFAVTSCLSYGARVRLR